MKDTSPSGTRTLSFSLNDIEMKELFTLARCLGVSPRQLAKEILVSEVHEELLAERRDQELKRHKGSFTPLLF